MFWSQAEHREAGGPNLRDSSDWVCQNLAESEETGPLLPRDRSPSSNAGVSHCFLSVVIRIKAGSTYY